MKRQELLIKYDNSLKLTTIDPGLWLATNPCRWFPNYKIISRIDTRTYDDKHFININEYIKEGEEELYAFSDITSSNALRLLVSGSLMNYSYMRTVQQFTIEGLKLLANTASLCEAYENKSWIRQKFGKTLPFPRYICLSLKELSKSNFSKISKTIGSESLIMQHPTLMGGRGTRILKHDDDIVAFRHELREYINPETEVIISEYIYPSLERSVQGCVTKKNVYIGPPQSQLIGAPELVSNDAKAVKFCGGRTQRALLTDEQYATASDYMKLIGVTLQREGYRGIFGVDFLLKDSKLYVLEVNPRITSMTPMLASLQLEIPFLLMHILELANVPYDIEDTSFQTVKSGSFIVVYAQEDITSDFLTGLYRIRDGFRISNGFENGRLIPDNEDEVFVVMKANPGTFLRQNTRIASLFSRQQLFNDDGKIVQEIHPLINRIRGYVS